MDFQLVLVENEDVLANKVLSSSGLMLNNKFVLLTSNIFTDDKYQAAAFNHIKPGKLYQGIFMENKTTINVISVKQSGLYNVSKSEIFGALVSENIKSSSRLIFQNWSLDSVENKRNLNDLLSLLIVLSLDENNTVEHFDKILLEWWNILGTLTFAKAQEILITSTPFGNRNFMNSCSKGIISNIMGNNSCFILSDCPSAPGSEGSPVFFANQSRSNEHTPFGIILSSMSWWRGEWTGVTLILNIKSMILELIKIPLRLSNNIQEKVSDNLIVNSEFCLAQIYSGSNWGTAVLLDSQTGTFITNSHVIDSPTLKLFYKGRSFDGQVIYKTPEDEAFDLAIIRSAHSFAMNMKSIDISNDTLKLGDTVYASGYSMFSKESNPTPTLTKGCLSYVSSSLLRTTCSIHPGASGGAVMDDQGKLIGIVVCNTKLEENGVVYSRINMAVPFAAVSDIIYTYLETGDSLVLSGLRATKEIKFVWKQFEGKL